MTSLPSVLYLSAGLEIEGGIAVVSRAIARALDDAVDEARVSRVDRVLLHDDGSAPSPRLGRQYEAGGSRVRFALAARRLSTRRRSDLLVLDHIGLGRALRFAAPRRLPEYSVFVYGRELDVEGRGAAARRRVIERAQKVLTISDHTRARIADRFPAKAEHIEVIPLCLDERKLAAWSRATPSSAARKPAVIITSRIVAGEPGKGHEALLDGWSSVLDAVPDAELWIVGEGTGLPILEDKARQLGLESARFFGRVSDAKLGELYRRASVFAMPSRQEGFGLVYAEAMWHGLPCIGSTADAAGCVIVDGETGVLVPFGDPQATSAAVVSLLTDTDKARRLGDAGRRRVLREFTYERFRAALFTALGLV